MMLCPYERAARGLRAWREWTGRRRTRSRRRARILHVPPLPELPRVLRGRSIVVIDGADAGDEADAPARARGAARGSGRRWTRSAHVPPAALSRTPHGPRGADALQGHGELLGGLAAAACDALVDAAGAEPGAPLLSWPSSATSAGRGRARARGRRRGRARCTASTCLRRRAGRRRRRWTRRSSAGLGAARAALAPWANGAQYLNFTEERVDPATFYARAATRGCRRSARRSTRAG